MLPALPSRICLSVALFTHTTPYDPDVAACDTSPKACPMYSKPPGFWPGDKGAEEWGRRNGVGAAEGRRRFHGVKQADHGRGKEKYSVNPETGEVANPEGEVVGSLDDVKAK
jgi:hypothetical protein